jgi:hypothetical protein
VAGLLNVPVVAAGLGARLRIMFDYGNDIRQIA